MPSKYLKLASEFKNVATIHQGRGANLHGTFMLKLDRNKMSASRVGQKYSIAKFVGSIKSLFVLKEPQLTLFDAVNLGRSIGLFGKDKCYAVTSNASNTQCLM